MNLIYSFALAIIAAAALTPAMIALARRRGWVVQPREDRWHRRPTAVYGGVAIYLAFLASFWALGPRGAQGLALAGCASAMFLIGLVDDIFDLKPQVKFLAQLLVATGAVALGLSFDILPWPWLNVPLTLLWLVGVTNAVNILDNMDGLSSGVALVAGAMLATISFMRGSPEVGLIAASLAGAAGGFLIYNFNPAKVFMGDCGSLFLGFTLAACTIMGAGGASHLTLSLLIPVGVLVVPLFDTTLVTFQRTSHGRSIAQGGRDHTSHRLVFLGMSERKAVLVLILISLAGGLGSLLLQFVSPLMAAVILAVAMVIFVFFGIFLGGVKVYDAKARPAQRWKSPLLGRVVLYKKQILQILADLLLCSAAYTASWLLRFEGQLNHQQMQLLTSSLPWVLAAKMFSLWVFGVYRGEWRYVSVHAMIQLAKAVLLGSLLAVLATVVLYRFEGFSRSAVIIDLFLCFMLLAGCRFLIRMFTESVASKKGTPVLIMGAGDGGEMLLRELKHNSSLPYVPVGFLDDDPAKRGLVIHGITVLGSREDLPRLLDEHGVRRVFIAILSHPEDGFEDIFAMCQEAGVKCTRIQPMIKL
jgi:UDP-GlcNAc:undecaprenyl-phosphate GlcNAc-1-phosphate transferase